MKIIYLILLIICQSITYSKIGRYNFQFNVGGGYQGVYKPASTRYTMNNNIPIIVNSPSYLANGGIFSMDLGYLFHSVRKNGTIHAWDIRGEFGMGFFKGVDVFNHNNIKQNILKIYSGISMTYMAGRQLESGRMMFDIIGYGTLVRHVRSQRYLVESSSNLPITSQTGLTIQTVLPGLQYIHQNGFTIGWRNKLKFLLGNSSVKEEFIAFNSVVSVGITIGKGKQPWEKNNE